MKLGIMVTTDRHLVLVDGITRAALARGHEVVIFNTDGGVRLLSDPSFQKLCGLDGVRVSFCALKAGQLEMVTTGLPEVMKSGSQLDNAAMAHGADRVINL